MRLPVVGLLLLIIASVGVDTYIYIVCRKRFRSKLPANVQLFSAIALYILLIVTISLPYRTGSEEMLASVMWLLFGYVSIYFSKYIFAVIDLVASLPLLFRRKRIRALSLFGAFAGVVLFISMWWGALINRYRIDVKEITVECPNLPAAFDGYRIVQFSDLHTGTYGADTTFVNKVVERINSLDPDMIAFTGDIVNRRTDEIWPFVPTLSRLEAPDGVISILGNHDYGDYADWPSEQAKLANMTDMYRAQKSMGWNLLLNDFEYIYRNGDSIAVIGVENIGDPPFHCYGSLPKSYPDMSDGVAKILLSHNPAHWVDSVSSAPASDMIDLTLSGHTHAMQIEVAGVSPAAMRYKTWGGLYESEQVAGRRLYVNIGLGTVGIPMRLGATPEITVITLKSLK
ncbi:MAG: metallophosphoesterase [Muribaculaceae bacterium]|nr:metallophosphoesterase [Muribaculaceae bacterium]